MNLITRKMSPSATTMVRMDHAHVLAQFHKLGPDTGETVYAATLRSICAALEIHAQLEEEIFYPALRQAAVDSPALDKSQPEHDEMRSLIAQLRQIEGGTRQARDDALNALMNAVLHHVADEETQLLPAAERQLGAQRLSELGATMTARRIELAKPRAGELARDLALAAPAKTALITVGAVLAGTVLVRSLRGSGHHHHRRF
jgi:hemerythrin superfamily protein